MDWCILAFTSWLMSLASTDFVAAIAGALVGGLIGLGGQCLLLRDNRVREASAQRHMKVAVATRIVMKVAKMHSSLFTQLKYISAALEVAKRESLRPHEALQPFVNEHRKVEFTAEELALISGLGESETLGNFLVLDDRYNAVIDLWITYKAERRDLERKLPPPRLEDGLAQSKLTEAEYKALELPRTILDDLANQLLRSTKLELKELSDILEVLVSEVNHSLQAGIAPPLDDEKKKILEGLLGTGGRLADS